jgi:hypothetical protein
MAITVRSGGEIIPSVFVFLIAVADAIRHGDRDKKAAAPVYQSGCGGFMPCLDYSRGRQATDFIMRFPLSGKNGD